MDCFIKTELNQPDITNASVHSLWSLGQAYGRISLRSRAAPINLPSMRGVILLRGKALKLSETEVKLLMQYQTLSTSKSKRFNRLAIEIIPPIVFVSIGLFTGNYSWFLALIAIMVVYNLQRVFRQQKYITELQLISQKVLAENTQTTNATKYGSEI
ncbi:hypothetical protein [Glaciecola sp. MF2-115]|uniref:hypothetical protein n=1 Tax=Glaciecola sp. MF2-115 TaxID=3384827 RepID=UPI00399FE33A